MLFWALKVFSSCTYCSFDFDHRSSQRVNEGAAERTNAFPSSRSTNKTPIQDKIDKLHTFGFRFNCSLLTLCRQLIFGLLPPTPYTYISSCFLQLHLHLACLFPDASVVVSRVSCLRSYHLFFFFPTEGDKRVEYTFQLLL